MLKIRRPLGRLIFNMGIAIPGKTVFLIETAPCTSQKTKHIQLSKTESIHHHIDGLVQYCSISIASALEILQSCTKPLSFADDILKLIYLCFYLCSTCHHTHPRARQIPLHPDSNVHGANMGPTWVLSVAPDGPHAGPMNFATRGIS